MVLAAGFSRRLPGANKLLKPYHGRPLLAHTLETVAGLGLADAVVVSGYEGEHIAEQAAQAGLRCVRNDEAASGMGSSIAAGVRALREGLAGVFIVLGDMPEVTPEDYARLAAAHEAQPARICVPVWEGRRGHPVLFGADHRGALAALTGDVGARSILREAADVLSVPAASAGVLVDLDTEADFAAPAPDGPPEPGCTSD
jgi:CTP:molybdopterin cytidylyltransferase MocA